ncbi:MAG: hypothetical protein L6Q92_13675 [Phycisphaerae bacterium]|nr:hypothetical protein [Phycisphaerae bacterium]
MNCNANTLPDECEGEQLSGGGESMGGAPGEEASSQDGESYEDRLAAFEAWIIEQDFTGRSVPEQMRRIKRKMLELDLWP